MDEMIKHFNDVVSAMDISIKDKMTILGLITAIGYKYQDDCKTYQDIIETDRGEIQWLKKCLNDLHAADVRPVVKARWNVGADGWECSNCTIEANNTYPICPYCGAEMEGS